MSQILYPILYVVLKKIVHLFYFIFLWDFCFFCIVLIQTIEFIIFLVLITFENILLSFILRLFYAFFLNYYLDLIFVFDSVPNFLHFHISYIYFSSHFFSLFTLLFFSHRILSLFVFPHVIYYLLSDAWSFYLPEDKQL